ncbi:Na+/H+ antiporter NhaA type [hydrothermal vent metagenome]|uniref:Na+/H+ antiporter NhaA type n=1 Tax=hydrothermal vent metagenome TaxID=652676 RepID=A0A3B0VGQ9_9ZZZZ
MFETECEQAPALPMIGGPYQKFFKKIVTGGILLLCTTLLALLWSGMAPEHYQHFWHTPLSISVGSLSISKSLLHWIDELLMALFFFTVGLEIKREIMIGELSSFRKAVLPVAAAIGGMLLPAVIFYIFNYNTETAAGWGIPMATDIAFALAVLSLVKNRVPYGVRIFLSALAIADDMGAVLVIAIFYTKSIAWEYFIIAAVCLVLLAIANRLWIRHTLVYAILGAGVWFSFMAAGIHATVAGVVVAMFIPARGRYDTDCFLRVVNKALSRFNCRMGDCGRTILLEQTHLNAVQNIENACAKTITPLQRLEHFLGSWVSLLILPLFALANAGMHIDLNTLYSTLSAPLSLGIIFGLTLGKPLGIFLFTFVTAKLLKTPLTQGMNWGHILGIGMLGGIGFTMSIFITSLSYSNPDFQEMAKAGILTATALSSILGLLVLAALSKKRKKMVS